MAARVVAAVLAATSLAPAPPAGAPDASTPAPTVLAPRLLAAAEDRASRMTVPVRVDGQGPFPFVVDTGADRTVISRELAAELKLAPGQPVQLNDTGGVGLAATARVGALQVGPVQAAGFDAPVLAEGDLGARGMLGIDSLRGRRIVMDFARRTLTVQPSRREAHGLDVVVVTARSRYGQLVLVDASIAGAPIAVIVDSGAQSSVGNRALQRLVGADGGGDLRQGPVQVISVAGRTTPARLARLPRVRIGGASLHNLPLAFSELHTFGEFGLEGTPAMLLGMDVLRRFDRVVVDFGRKEVSFRFPVDG